MTLIIAEVCDFIRDKLNLDSSSPRGVRDALLDRFGTSNLSEFLLGSLAAAFIEHEEITIDAHMLGLTIAELQRNNRELWGRLQLLEDENAELKAQLVAARNEGSDGASLHDRPQA